MSLILTTHRGTNLYIGIVCRVHQTNIKWQICGSHTQPTVTNLHGNFSLFATIVHWCVCVWTRVYNSFEILFLCVTFMVYYVNIWAIVDMLKCTFSQPENDGMENFYGIHWLTI